MAEYKSKVVILGSGPAGLTAAIYASRANLAPTLISGITPGGQLTQTTDVDNFPGFPGGIQGPELMQKMQEHAEEVGANFVYDHISETDLSKRPFTLTSDNGDTYLADTLIISTGAKARWLGLPSEDEFMGFGVSGCATCDGFFYKDKPVVVIGGGNTAVEEAIYLAGICSKVYLVHRRDELRAEKALQDIVLNNPKIEVVWNHVVDEIVGGGTPKGVTGINLKSTVGNDKLHLDVDGVFIAIGHDPATGLFKDQLEMDSEGYVIVQPGRTTTSVPGVFAAGDVADSHYQQAITAAGSGCMAALDADVYLRDNPLK
ncbi:MAG: thioredoxin-disulfide reductase [Alphaproteobacteria bacterium]